jgi:DNA (cytosine-5)-methyltransferase 1
MNDKPPFVVPSMAEIAAVPWNGRTLVSLFAGCGGSSLGYRMAGYKVLFANEFVPAAREVYELNASKGTVVDGRDIRELKPEQVLRAIGLRKGELDLLDGSPPCASFSTAGKRQEGWGQERKYSDTRQRVDDLFFEYGRMLDGLQPRAFVAENVSGLTKGVAKGYFLEVLAMLKKCGYRVGARVLDAQWLGVPQMRQRIIFVGVRNDMVGSPIFPKPLPYRYSVRDALPWLGEVRYGSNDYKCDPKWSFPRGQVNDGSEPCGAILSTPGVVAGVGGCVVTEIVHGDYSTSRKLRGQALDADAPAPTVVAGTHGGGPSQFKVQKVAHNDVVDDNVAASLDGYAVGTEYDKLNPGQQSKKFFSLVRPDADDPCPTIQSGAGSGAPGSVAAVTHPFERRKFTIGELKRICAFPDDFKMTGSYAQQWERLGRAVPPVMMKKIAETLRDEVFAKMEKVDGRKAGKAGDTRRLDVPKRGRRAKVRRARPGAAAMV